LPLPLLGGLLDEELGASNCSPAMQLRSQRQFLATPQESSDKEIPIGITRLLFLSCPTSLLGSTILA
jgi:hypothetical protein